MYQPPLFTNANYGDTVPVPLAANADPETSHQASERHERSGKMQRNSKRPGDTGDAGTRREVVSVDLSPSAAAIGAAASWRSVDVRCFAHESEIAK